MSSLPTVNRHYPKVAGLVRRTKADLTDEFLRIRTLTNPFLIELFAAKPKKPSLTSSAHGEIKRLLFTIPKYAVTPPRFGQENPLAAVYKDLIAKLPPQVKLIVATHASVEPEVARWLKAADLGDGSTVIAFPDHLHFSIWAEDGYVVMTDKQSKTTYFVEPYQFPRYGDSLIADFVANNSDLENTQAPLYFQGGNLLIGDDFFFIGVDYPTNSLQYVGSVIVREPNEQPQDTIKRLYKEYLDAARNLFYIGSTIPVPAERADFFTKDGVQWREMKFMGNKEGTAQPLFHIDMFMTLAGRDKQGKYQVLVGDPRLAAEILNVPVWPHGMVEVFDNIAKGLGRLGFKVIRNPLPLVYVDDSSEKTRYWYFATGNNALVQIPKGRGKKIVWLPTYGHGAWLSLAATDKKNKEIWEGLGFEVRMLGDFHPFAENLGAVHCIKKYLGRS